MGFQRFLFRSFLCPCLLFRSLRGFQPGSQLLQGRAAAFAAAGRFGSQGIQFGDPFLRVPQFFRDPQAVFLPALPAVLQLTGCVFRFMYCFHSLHEGGMGRSDLFIQVLDLCLASIPFPGFFFNGLLILRQDRLHVLQFVIRFAQFRFHLFRTDQEEVQVQHLQPGRQVQVDPGVFRVLFQRAEAVFQFLQQVVHPGDILLGAGKLLVRFLLARPELDDTGRFLKDLAAVLSLAGQDLVNTALADNGIALLADTGIAEQVHNVLQAAGGTVQEIFTFPASIDPAGHQDLRVIQGKAFIFIVKDQGNLTVAQGLPALGTAENNVLHAGAAQNFGALFPEHPAYRVGNIAFSGSVRSHDRGDAFLEDNLSPLCEGLEPVKLQLL